jgi:transcriptional regulator with GAF, ATPase, and Fis domain
MRQILPRSTPGRFGTWAYPWAQTSLAALAAELATVREREQVVPTILQAALRLLHAEAAALSLYDHHHNPHAVAVAAADRHWSPLRSLAVRAPLDFRRQANGTTGDVLVLPTDDPQHPFAPLLAHAASTAIYIALSYGGKTLGALHAVRPAACSFTPEDRRLARGIGDHAVLALTTVRVV